jgi:hypothetical protein
MVLELERDIKGQSSSLRGFFEFGFDFLIVFCCFRLIPFRACWQCWKRCRHENLQQDSGYPHRNNRSFLHKAQQGDLFVLKGQLR